MASHAYTYVRSKDVNVEHIDKRWNQISQMSKAEAIQHILRLNQQVSARFSRFHELLAQPTYDEMMERGAYWRDFQSAQKNADSIKNVSSLNLYRVVTALKHVNPKYVPLMTRLEEFPWTLKHNTKPTYIATIKRDRLLMSLTEIHRRGLGDTLKGGTDHEGLDDKMIHNEDFVFFRLSCGTDPAHSRFGSECLVFKPDQLFRLGWVSLHDMLSPASTDRMCRINEFQTLEQIEKPSPFGKPVRTMTAPPGGIQYNYPQNRKAKPVILRRAQIVFFGPDIRRGIAMSVVNELFQMGGEEMLDLAMKYVGEQHTMVLLNLINNLFWLEAKIPRFFLFAPNELLMAHSNVPYTKGSGNMM